MSVAASFSHSGMERVFFDGFGVMLFLVCYEVKGHNYTEGIGNCGDGVGLCGGGKRFPILYTGDYGKTKRIPCHFVGVLHIFPLRHAFGKIWEGDPKSSFFRFMEKCWIKKVFSFLFSLLWLLF